MLRVQAGNVATILVTPLPSWNPWGSGHLVVLSGGEGQLCQLLRPRKLRAGPGRLRHAKLALGAGQSWPRAQILPL